MCLDLKIAVENNTVCRARGADALRTVSLDLDGCFC